MLNSLIDTPFNGESRIGVQQMTVTILLFNR
jgi:hypothetical protein